MSEESPIYGTSERPALGAAHGYTSAAAAASGDAVASQRRHGCDDSSSASNENSLCADDARVACPLFQAEYGGSTPTSALQLKIGKVNTKLAVRLNRQWHSRLPELVNWQGCESYAAECGNVFYAVAMWGQPVARMLNGRGWYELRRMAIADDAPPNTGSRMLRVMRILIGRDRPEVTRLISYQDTEVHTGTIYKAAGWIIGSRREARVHRCSPGPDRWKERSRTLPGIAKAMAEQYTLFICDRDEYMKKYGCADQQKQPPRSRRR